MPERRFEVCVSEGEELLIIHTCGGNQHRMVLVGKTSDMVEVTGKAKVDIECNVSDTGVKLNALFKAKHKSSSWISKPAELVCCSTVQRRN